MTRTALVAALYHLGLDSAAFEVDAHTAWGDLAFKMASRRLSEVIAEIRASHEIGLVSALTSVAGSPARWAALTREGATDATIKALIAREITSQGGGTTPKGHYRYAGGAKPEVRVTAGGTERVYQGPTLVKAARVAFAIPMASRFPTESPQYGEGNPDTRPVAPDEAFWVTARDSGSERYALLLGPFDTHVEALEAVHRGRQLVHKHFGSDLDAAFASTGTSRTTRSGTPVFLADGTVNPAWEVKRAPAAPPTTYRPETDPSEGLRHVWALIVEREARLDAVARLPPGTSKKDRLVAQVAADVAADRLVVAVGDLPDGLRETAIEFTDADDADGLRAFVLRELGDADPLPGDGGDEDDGDEEAGEPPAEPHHPPKPGSRQAERESEIRDDLLGTWKGRTAHWQRHLTRHGFPGYAPTPPTRAADTYLSNGSRYHPAVAFSFLNAAAADVLTVHVGVTGLDEFVLGATRTVTGDPSPERILALGTHGASRVLDGPDPETALADPSYAFPVDWLRGLRPSWGNVRLVADSRLPKGDRALLDALLAGGLADFLAAEGVSAVHVPQDGPREAFDLLKVPPIAGTWSDVLPTRAFAIQHVSEGNLDNQAVFTLQQTPKGGWRVASVLHTAVGWRVVRSSADAALSEVWGANVEASFRDLLRTAVDAAIGAKRPDPPTGSNRRTPAPAGTAEQRELVAQLEAVFSDLGVDRDGKHGATVRLTPDRAIHVVASETGWQGRVVHPEQGALLGLENRNVKDLATLFPWIRARATFVLAQVGDTLQVTCAPASSSSPDETRTVTITGHTRDDANLHATLYVTSGKVRPGHVAGGSIIDFEAQGGLQYQPTMQQPTRPVRALTLASAPTPVETNGPGSKAPSTPVTVTTQAHVDRRSASTEDLAADYKARGLDLSRAYNELIKDRALAPGIDLRDFRGVFEGAHPRHLVGETKTETITFVPTHHDAVTDRDVMVAKTDGGLFVTWANGYRVGPLNHLEWPGERWVPLTGGAPGPVPPPTAGSSLVVPPSVGFVAAGSVHHPSAASDALFAAVEHFGRFSLVTANGSLVLKCGVSGADTYYTAPAGSSSHVGQEPTAEIERRSMVLLGRVGGELHVTVAHLRFRQNQDARRVGKHGQPLPPHLDLPPATGQVRDIGTHNGFTYIAVELDGIPGEWWGYRVGDIVLPEGGWAALRSILPHEENATAAHAWAEAKAKMAAKTAADARYPTLPSGRDAGTYRKLLSSRRAVGDFRAQPHVADILQAPGQYGGPREVPVYVWGGGSFARLVFEGSGDNKAQIHLTSPEGMGEHWVWKSTKVGRDARAAWAKANPLPAPPAGRTGEMKQSPERKVWDSAPTDGPLAGWENMLTTFSVPRADNRDPDDPGYTYQRHAFRKGGVTIHVDAWPLETPAGEPAYWPKGQAVTVLEKGQETPLSPKWYGIDATHAKTFPGAMELVKAYVAGTRPGTHASGPKPAALTYAQIGALPTYTIARETTLAPGAVESGSRDESRRFFAKVAPDDWRVVVNSGGLTTTRLRDEDMAHRGVHEVVRSLTGLGPAGWKPLVEEAKRIEHPTAAGGGTRRDRCTPTGGQVWTLDLAGKEIVVYRRESPASVSPGIEPPSREVARVGTYSGARRIQVVGSGGPRPPARDSSKPEIVDAPDFTPARVWGGTRTPSEADALVRRYLPQVGFPVASSDHVRLRGRSAPEPRKEPPTEDDPAAGGGTGPASTPFLRDAEADPAGAFLRAWEAATGATEDDPGLRRWAGRAEARLERRGRDEVHLTDLRAYAPGGGDGAAMLRTISALADAHGVGIALTAEPFPILGEAPTTTQLVAWYRAHGFRGDDESPHVMYREPTGSPLTGARHVEPVFTEGMTIRALLDGAEPGVEAVFRRLLGDGLYTLPYTPTDAMLQAALHLYGNSAFVGYVTRRGYPAPASGLIGTAWRENAWRKYKRAIPVPAVPEEVLEEASRSDEAAGNLVTALTDARWPISVQSEKAHRTSDWRTLITADDEGLGTGSGKTRKEAIREAIGSNRVWDRVWTRILAPYLRDGSDPLGRLKAALDPGASPPPAAPPAHPSGFATGHVADPPKAHPREGRKPRERVETAGCRDVTFVHEGLTVTVTCGSVGKTGVWHNVQVAGGPKKLFYGWSGERWSRGEIPSDDLLRAVRRQGVAVFPDPDVENA